MRTLMLTGLEWGVDRSPVSVRPDGLIERQTCEAKPQIASGILMVW